MERSFLLAAIVALLLVNTEGCVYMYGESPLAKEFAAPKGTKWNYAFHGHDWDGVDAKNVSWQCMTGRQQSPINIAHPATTDKAVNNLHKTSLNFGVVTSNGSNVEVINTGHTIQVQWSDAQWKPNVTVAVPAGASKLQQALEDTTGPNIKRVSAKPLQFHWHTASEHFLDGHYYPLELHVVSTVSSDQLPGCTGPLGCLTVVGVLFELSDDLNAENKFLKDILAVMPEEEGVTKYLPAGSKLDFTVLLPANQTYVTYPGSLTTPPCSEGVLWHVMTTPQKMSLKQWLQIQRASGDSMCKLVEKTNSTSTSGRRLLADTKGVPSSSYVCEKLGNAQNYRDPQPLYDRSLYAYKQS